jgi:hypothetical protein
MPTGKYSGRLATDGNGNLLADNPDDPSVHGFPVAYDEGVYIFVQPGEPSHNERYHQNLAEFSGTVDESMVDPADSDLVNAEEGGDNAHHFDQPDPNEPAPLLPDAQAAVTTSHTDAATTNE